MYRVEFTASAAREFRSLEESIKRRIAAAIDELCENEEYINFEDMSVYIA